MVQQPTIAVCGDHASGACCCTPMFSLVACLRRSECRGYHPDYYAQRPIPTLASVWTVRM